jgi:hypothetical protein
VWSNFFLFKIKKIQHGGHPQGFLKTDTLLLLYCFFNIAAALLLLYYSKGRQSAGL